MSQLSLFDDNEKKIPKEKEPVAPKKQKRQPRQKGFNPREGIDKRNTRIFMDYKKEEKNNEMMSDSEYDEFTKDINAKFGISKKHENLNSNADLADDLPF